MKDINVLFLQPLNALVVRIISLSPQIF